MTVRELAGLPDAGGAGPLLAALAASIALHAVALAGLPDLWTYSERPASAPLNAWLEPAARAVAMPEAQAPAVAPPERIAPQPKRAAPRPKPAAVAVSPAAERVEPAASPAAAPATVTESAPAGDTKSEARPVLALGTPTLAPRAGDEALEAGSLAQYRLALIGAAKRLKQYPAQAVDRGVQGRVDVRLVIGAGGEPATVTVKRSSGHELLDRQAVDTMRKATAATPIPPALRHREIVVEIPVLYELKSES